MKKGQQTKKEGQQQEGDAVSQDFLLDVAAKRSGESYQVDLVQEAVQKEMKKMNQKKASQDNNNSQQQQTNRVSNASQDFLMEVVATRSQQQELRTSSASAAQIVPNKQMEWDRIDAAESTILRKATIVQQPQPAAAEEESRPGAFPMAPRRSNNNAQQSAEMSADMSPISEEGADYQVPLSDHHNAPIALCSVPSQFPQPSQLRQPNQLLLSVASPVVEEDPSALPRAQERDESRRQGQRERTKQFKTNLVWMVILCLVIGAAVILVSVLLSSNQSSSSDTPTPQATIASSPSPAPTSMEAYVLSLLPEETIGESMQDPQSPQSQALAWLLSDDIEHLIHLSDERILQRFVLASLYFSTDGNDWTRNDHWLSQSVHECDWYTKDVFALQDTIGAAYPGYLKEFSPEGRPPNCNVRGLYQNLWLDQNNLMGSLPEELYLLTSLKTLSLGLNDLEGTFSSRIGNLRELEGLAFWGMKNAGTIPTQIGYLTGLRGLGLSENGHHGTLPTELWRLTNLSTLILYLMPNLKGSIPTQVGNLKKLRHFTISAVDFTGTIPTELEQLQRLEWLNLGQNRFTGTVPAQLGLLPEILLMAMEQNSLEGTIPTELGLLTSSTLLSFNDNLLQGSIVTEFGRLTSLALGLTLQNNLLDESIPTELGLLTHLQTLSFHNNQLTGDIPSELGQLISAGKMDFGGNSLSGTIPEQLSVLQATLFAFNTADNPELWGTVPEDLCNINKECQRNSLNPRILPCEGMDGLSFDCTSQLCGCDCVCSDFQG